MIRYTLLLLFVGLAFWDEVLTVNEISALYNSGPPLEEYYGNTDYE
jgi:hypothetical protein